MHKGQIFETIYNAVKKQEEALGRKLTYDEISALSKYWVGIAAAEKQARDDEDFQGYMALDK